MSNVEARKGGLSEVSSGRKIVSPLDMSISTVSLKVKGNIMISLVDVESMIKKALSPHIVISSISLTLLKGR